MIDDGSIDDTTEHCRAALVEAPFPVTFIARENRGAAATLNQGIALAKGDFIQLLNSDDRLPAERIATMLPMLLESNADWGYARVSYIDTLGQSLDHLTDARIAALMAAQNATVMSGTLGLAMLRANSAISSGNLMFRKRLWETLGGFRDYRYNHDWDFCLRATLQCEPVLAPQPLYEYRVHDRNTITEAAGVPRHGTRQGHGCFRHPRAKPIHLAKFFCTYFCQLGWRVSCPAWRNQCIATFTYCVNRAGASGSSFASTLKPDWRRVMRVSLIVASEPDSFNHKQRNFFASVAAQTYPHYAFELIFVDGQAKASTSRAFAEFRRQYPAISASLLISVQVRHGRPKTTWLPLRPMVICWYFSQTTSTLPPA